MRRVWLMGCLVVGAILVPIVGAGANGPVLSEGCTEANDPKYDDFYPSTVLLGEVGPFNAGELLRVTAGLPDADPATIGIIVVSDYVAFADYTAGITIQWSPAGGEDHVWWGVGGGAATWTVVCDLDGDGDGFFDFEDNFPAVYSRCGRHQATIIGTDDPDLLNGTDGDDVIMGFGGDDEIHGRGGRDVICAGPGNDTVTGGRGKDRITGNGGHDTISGNRGHDRIRGGTGDDTLFGGRGNDLLDGGRGTNHLDGGPGADQCQDPTTWVACEVIQV